MEPSTVHHYKPLWTLVGGGIYPRELSKRSEASVIPEGAEWLRDTVTSFVPDSNEIMLQSGSRLNDDYLVVCLGMHFDWEKIEGLKGNIGNHGICSNYSYETVQYTWPLIESFKGGMPCSPILIRLLSVVVLCKR